VDNGLVIEGSPGHSTLERDAALLKSSRWPALDRRDEQLSVQERDEVLHRAAAQWPSEPSALLRFAAVAHGIEDGLDERFAEAPERLTALVGRQPWSVEPREAQTLGLAVLVCLERLDYASFAPHYGTSMVLRDALTGSEDLATMAAIVRWESLERMGVSIPDRLLDSWTREVSSIAGKGHAGTDPNEYINTLDIRDHLQRFVAVLSWVGHEQWRPLIEPVDDSFRGCTERQEVPLVLNGHAEPGGWWRYRLPVGAADLPGWRAIQWRAIQRLEPERYVAGYSFGLRTISHVWELAERPNGLAAMTAQELDRWAALCAYQADGETREGAEGPWSERHQRVGAERRRRTADQPSSD
jgi:hypothetical protein